MMGPTTRRSRIFAPLALLVLAALAWVAWNHFPGSSPAPAGRPAAAGVGGRHEVFYGPPNSLAVLPFQSAAEATEDAVLGEGLAAGLLDRLAAEPGLRVTARSSSFFFRDRGGGHRIIAERLQSRHLLDGKFRREGENAILSLALFDARENREVWRQEYAADLPGLLGTLGAIGDDIVAVSPIPPGEPRPAGPAPDTQAWVQYARGLYYADPSREQDLAGAVAALESALSIDPTYAAARLELAGIWLHPAWLAAEAGGESVARAREAVQFVLDEDPAAARAWAVLSYILHQHDWDWSGAAAAGRRAAELGPGDAGVLGVAALALATVGEFAAAQELLQESVGRDPLNLGRRLRLGLLQEFRGEFDAALATYRQLLVLNPDYPGAYAYRARVKVLQGKPDSALAEAEQESDPFWRRYARILALSAQGEAAEAEPLLQEMVADSGSVAAFQLVEILAFSGAAAEAFEWLDRAYARRDPGLASVLGNRFLEALHEDARWPEWLTRLGLNAVDGFGD
jgi:TolB-like protein/Tfp pilus assembly protein PilF